MHSITLLCFALFNLLLVVNCAHLPSFISGCRRNNPQFDQCILSESKKMFKMMLGGYPELGVPSLSPLKIKNFTLSDGFDGLHVNATNAVIRGIKDDDLKDFKIDFRSKSFSMRLIHSMTITCKYITYGRLLQIPIKGNGNLEVTITELDWNMFLKWDLVKGKDNKEYMRVKKSKSKYDVQKAHFDFDGLINKQVDMAMKKLMNDNWRSVVADLGDPALNVMQKKYTDIINTILSKVPFDALFPV